MIAGSPIYTTEPMATRALAAEIRHDHSQFVQMLEQRSGTRPFGTLSDIRCETDKRLDVVMDFVDGGDTHRVGIEAKFDHELTREQINTLRSAYRLMFADEGTFQERLDDAAELYGDNAEVMEIIAFIRADANRPLCLPEREV